MSRRGLARLGAPAAFLAAVTVAVLLVRAGLQREPARTTTTAPTIARTATAVTVEPTTSTAERRSKPRRARRFYTIVAGDTFEIVAGKTSTTVERLRVLNPGVDSTMLQVGQRIRVR